MVASEFKYDFTKFFCRLALLFGFLLFLGSAAQAQELGELEKQRITAVLPQATSISEPEGDYGVRTLKQGEEV